MATHSSILAWRSPWTEEPGGLHTVHGVARVGHDLATKPPPGGKHRVNQCVPLGQAVSAARAFLSASCWLVHSITSAALRSSSQTAQSHSQCPSLFQLSSPGYHEIPRMKSLLFPSNHTRYICALVQLSISLS